MTRWMTSALIAAAALTAAACGGSSTKESSVDEKIVADPPALAAQPLPELDIDTLTADTEAGPVDVTSSPGTSFTGTVSGDLFIGAALADDTDGDGVHDAFIYLCDGASAVYLDGEVGPDSTTIRDEAEGGTSVSVDVRVDGDVLRGAVVIGDEEPMPFTADAAEGSAGLYRAEFEFEDVTYHPMWIVLADGRQRGQASYVKCLPDGHCYEVTYADEESGMITREPTYSGPSIWDWYHEFEERTAEN